MARVAERLTDIPALSLAIAAEAISDLAETVAVFRDPALGGPRRGASRSIRPIAGTRVLARYHRANRIAENRRLACKIVSGPRHR
jgi:hypothetical protein